MKSRTGGSTFKNPPGHKAWQLIDAAGCRGLVVGDAQVSELHCNFLINRGNATAADIENLGEEVRRRVKENSGVDARVGDQADRRRVTKSDVPHAPSSLSLGSASISNARLYVARAENSPQPR